MKIGNSLCVTVPAYFARTIGIKAGEQVKVETLPERGKVVYQFSNIKQLPLSNNFLRRRRRKKPKK